MSKSRIELGVYPLYPGGSGTAITIGTVTIGAVGVPPQVTVRGTAPNQILDFVLPNPLAANGFRAVTDTSGTVTVLDTDGILSIETGVATTVSFAPKPGQSFIVKDALGVDGQTGTAITIAPTTGLIDGQAVYVLNKSVLNSPPYESVAVFCKPDGDVILL